MEDKWFSERIKTWHICFHRRKKYLRHFPKKRKKKNCVARAMWNEISFMDKALFPVFSLPNNDFFWQVNQISINLTTNERINKKRYVYLRGPSGIFLNPFDRGCLKNWLEYFHWVEPYDKKPNLMYNVWSIISGSTGGMWLGMITPGTG